MRRIRERLRTEMRSLRGANAAGGAHTAQPHHQGLVGLLPEGGVQRDLHGAGYYLWKLTYKWAVHSHPNKPKRWIVSRYFGMFNKSRRDRWVFGDRDSGAYLHRFAWTKIVRHQMVRGTSSPDDPALAEYWADRRRKGIPPPIDAGQPAASISPKHGRCPLCGDWLLRRRTPATNPTRVGAMAGDHPQDDHQERHRHCADGTPDETKPRLIHTHCTPALRRKRQ